MNSMMHIGNAPGAPDIKGIAEAITSIFQVGHATHMEQDTIQEALGAFTKVGQVTGVTISGATLTNHASPADVGMTIDSSEPAKSEDDSWDICGNEAVVVAKNVATVPREKPSKPVGKKSLR